MQNIIWRAQVNGTCLAGGLFLPPGRPTEPIVGSCTSMCGSKEQTSRLGSQEIDFLEQAPEDKPPTLVKKRVEDVRISLSLS